MYKHTARSFLIADPTPDEISASMSVLRRELDAIDWAGTLAALPFPQRLAVEHLLLKAEVQRAKNAAMAKRLEHARPGARFEELWSEDERSAWLSSPEDDAMRNVCREIASWTIADLHRLQELPTSPAVYAFCAGSTVVYIGTTRNLKTRLDAHFLVKSEKAAMVMTIWGPVRNFSLRYKPGASGRECIETEGRLIDLLRPIFNSRLGDGAPRPRSGLLHERLQFFDSQIDAPRATRRPRSPATSPTLFDSIPFGEGGSNAN